MFIPILLKIHVLKQGGLGIIFDRVIFSKMSIHHLKKSI